MTTSADVEDVERCIAHRRIVRSFGSTITVEANAPDLLERLTTRLPPLATRTQRASRPRLRLFVRDRGLCHCGREHASPALFREGFFQASGELDQLLDWFGRAAKLFIAERAPDRVFVHAGVVAVRDRLVVIPGRSMSGKTTLVLALMQCGATYYSDEYAVVDGNGLVHPYPQPLGVRDGGWVQAPLDPESMGWVPGTRPLPMALVVTTEHVAGTTYHPRELSPGQVAFDLMQHAVPIRRAPERALDYLVKASAHARGVSGARGDAAEAARAIIAAVARA